MSQTNQKKDQTGVSVEAFNKQASLVIYAENAAAVEIANEIVRQLDNRDVRVQVRAKEAPLPAGSWGC